MWNKSVLEKYHKVAAEHMSEASVRSAYAVVYRRTETAWEVQAPGWCEVHLFRDSSDNSFRILAWEVGSDQHSILLNQNVTKDCDYVLKSNDFHSFQNEFGDIIGFGFFSDGGMLENAAKFQEAVLQVIGGGIELSTERKATPTTSMIMRLTGGPVVEWNFDDEVTSYGKPPAASPLGILTIGIPKPARRVSGPKLRLRKGMDISDPIKVSHDRHVVYDPETKTFQGLPEGWGDVLNRNFGLPLSQMHSEMLPNYDGEIPRVLILMRDYLINNGGLECEGIFRLAPNSNECKLVRESLDLNTFDGCDDVNCIANCIKIFFRELPQNLFHIADVEAIKRPEEAGALVLAFPNPYRSVFLYLLDLCVLLASNKEVNKMGAQNLAIVIAPNLFNLTELPPMESVMLSQKIVGFLYQAILWRESLGLLDIDEVTRVLGDDSQYEYYYEEEVAPEVDAGFGQAGAVEVDLEVAGQQFESKVEAV